MVLQERIELSTSPLPRVCSTTELLQNRSVFADRGGDLDDNFGGRKSNFTRNLDALKNSR